MPAVVELDRLSRTFGDFAAVTDFNLTVNAGQFVALLGPSGCGKTTSLRMIAGYITPTAGRVLLEGQDATHLPPERRNIGMVFQSYALFPHMTVAENVAFGLQMRKVPQAEIKDRVAATLKLVDLADLGGRFPKELSGGQQQRVALARAVVIRPSVLLLDEPLSNLDARLRQQMRDELKRVQREVGLTAILVTHDQEEALALADHIAILNRGRLEQAGAPKAIFRRPATRFVADFLGFENFLTLSSVGLVTIRPEYVEVLPAAGAVAPSDGTLLPGEVLTATFRGTETALTVRTEAGTVHAVVSGDAWTEGDAVTLFLPGARLVPLAG